MKFRGSASAFPYGCGERDWIDRKGSILKFSVQLKKRELPGGRG